MTQRNANRFSGMSRWMRQGGIAAVAASLVITATAGAQAQSQADGQSRTGVEVSVPNGYLNVAVNDLSVQSTGGPVSWMRRWDGQEWKFNPYWESLSQSWKNLTGSQTADTTGSTLSSSGGATSPTLAASGGSSDGGCWVWVDEDWQPSTGTTTVGGIPQAGPMLPERMTPFNRVMGEDTSDYQQPVTVTVDYASLCAGTATGLGVRDVEGIRRENELYLGDQGRYAFSNRAVLEKRAVSTLPVLSAPALYAQLATGSISVSPVTNPKGYRWIHKEGDWIEYNTQGQVVRYGDRNDNIVWLVRDSDGVLRGVADANGHVVYSLHYTGALLTEVRDYSIAGNSLDLPARSVRYQYDDKNRMTVVTDARGYTVQYEYDGQNHITKVTDQDGHFEQFAYNGDTVSKRTAADGAVTDYVFEYDDTNKQFASTITGPETSAGRRKEDYTHNRVGQLVRRIVNGRVDEEVRYDTGARAELHTNVRGFSTRITRNEFDQVVEVDQPDGTSLKSTYSALHLQPIEETDELGTKAQYQYDAKGNQTKHIEAVGTVNERVTDYEVNSLGQTTKVTRRGRTEANGTVTLDAVWHIEYDEQGNKKKITDPEGHARQYIFNRAGSLVSAIDGRGNTTLYEVNAAGNVTKVTDALGRVQVYVYDGAGNLKSATDARGKSVLASYDAMNRFVQATNPGGGIRNVQYNGQGSPISVTDEDGRTDRFDFDAFLLMIKHTDARGNATQFGYQIPDGGDGTAGSLAQPTQINYPTFTEQQRFDQLERPTTTTLMNRNEQGVVSMVTSTSYEPRGQVKSVTDPYGKIRSYMYDSLGQLTQTTDALGNKTIGQYDARGNLLQLTDPKGNTTRFEYDRADRLVKETKPLGQISSYQYDENGNLALAIDGKGNRVVFTYDAANRLRKKEVTPAGASAPSETCTYDYDSIDNLTAWNDGNASAALTYNDDGRKLSETVSYGNGVTLAYSYTYTAAGYKRTLSYPDGTVVTYTHDANGQLAQVDIPGEGTMSVNEWNWVVPKKLTLPGGTVKQLEQDGLLSLSNLIVANPNQQPVFSFSGSYGSSEEPTRRSIDGGVNTFTYDDEQRLTQVSGVNPETFLLDVVGNRLNQSGSAVPWQYDSNNRITQADGVTYDYDDAGNLIRKTTSGVVTQYKYDGLNRLLQVQDAANTVIVSYGYDPNDRRLWKDVNGARTYFLHSDEGLIAEVNSTGSITTQYGWKPDGTWGTDPLFIKTAIGIGPSAQMGYAYFHNDDIGTPLRATDKLGNIVWSASYSAFGRATVAAVSQLLSNLRFAGQYYDSETGLNYNWHRYYDSAVGRYTTSDPVGLLAGMNLYAYAGSNPLWNIDPLGLAYGTAEEAARAALCSIYPTSFAQDREYGGRIISVGGGFDFTPPNTDNLDTKYHLHIPDVYTTHETHHFLFFAYQVPHYQIRGDTVGWYHTHGAPGKGDRSYSPDDAKINHDFNIPGWYTDGNGVVRRGSTHSGVGKPIPGDCKCAR